MKYNIFIVCGKESPLNLLIVNKLAELFLGFWPLIKKLSCL